MDNNAALIIQLLKEVKKPLTAMEIINDRFPGKSQPYINSTINALVDKGILNRHNTRPYTVELVDDSSEVSQKNTVIHPVRIDKMQNRGDILKQEFNDFWNEFFHTEQDYYSSITFEKLIKLKMAIRNINNLVTYETTLMAANLIADLLNINDEQRSKIIASIESTSENANGYDIEYQGNTAFICEVKGNIPSGGKPYYGAAQKREIQKDIDSLLFGKTKSSLNEQQLKDCYKFLCLYNAGDISVRAAQQLVKNLVTEYANRIELLDNQKVLSKDKIYILFVSK